MITDIVDAVANNPEISTATAAGVLVVSEALGFTKKGGILKIILSVLIFLGRAAAEFDAKRQVRKKIEAAEEAEEHG